MTLPIAMSIDERNTIKTFKFLLNSSNVKFANRTLTESLVGHPDFPSLMSLSDILTDFNVKNIAVQIPKEKIYEIPLPSVVYLEIEGGIFAVVNKISNRIVEWFHAGEGLKQEAESVFFDKWTGVALLVEADEKSGDLGYLKDHKRETTENVIQFLIDTATLSCISLFIYLIVQRYPISDNLQKYGLIITKLTGLFLSCLLVSFSFDSNNIMFRTVCRSGSSSGCSDILSTSSAKMFDFVSWADVGVVYFLGGLASVFFGLVLNLNCIFKYHVYLSILALPFTFYSIYLQFFKIRKICFLCLAVQFLLWIEAAAGYKFLIVSGDGAEVNLLIFISTFILSGALFFKTRTAISSFMSLFSIKRELNKLKFNADIIDATFNNTRVMPPISKVMNVIKFKKANVANTITLVINPLCQPCRSTYFEIIDILNKSSTIDCELVFTATNSQGDSRGNIGRRLLSLPTEKIMFALNEWFVRGDHNLAKWIENTGAFTETEEAYSSIDYQSKWCASADIKVTPTIFLNGRELPSMYQIKDIPMLYKRLIDRKLDVAL